jgi:hypothetical protein
MVHRDGWDIEIRPPKPGGTGWDAYETVWFIPPRTIDPTRTPIIAGRAKFDLTAQELMDTEQLAS